jgi:hypothetical protein
MMRDDDLIYNEVKTMIYALVRGIQKEDPLCALCGAPRVKFKNFKKIKKLKN